MLLFSRKRKKPQKQDKIKIKLDNSLVARYINSKNGFRNGCAVEKWFALLESVPCHFKVTVMQIEKALINNGVHVSKVS